MLQSSKDKKGNKIKGNRVLLPIKHMWVTDSEIKSVRSHSTHVILRETIVSLHLCFVSFLSLSVPVRLCICLFVQCQCQLSLKLNVSFDPESRMMY